ncbi:MAG TPA: quinone-dependent dihydroorotate dehydrogenase [Actinocrinis sp.]|nr:quinone-dependent dihydroorotate dehydrogenase [Actinocrinis sp.]
MYRLFFALVFQRMDPERAHHLGFGAIRAAGALPGAARLGRALCGPRDPSLRVRALGLDFPGPFGLAAGFDKDAVGIDGLAALGFGFVEVGTVTAQAQPGNPAPRMFRLPEDRALINRMGFNNHGAAAAAARLAARRGTSVWRRARTVRVVVGVNIGKTKAAAEAEAVGDYAVSARAVAPYADYLVVNVSSPNTPGLRDLQAVGFLRPLLLEVRRSADEAAGRHVPLLVKIAPDLADEDIDAVAALALEIGLDGIIATNTTISRDGLRTGPDRVAQCGAGGLSGPVLRDRALTVLRRLRAQVGEEMTIIAAGGIVGAEDAAERLAAGATLLQGYTGFIYQGPFWARRIHRGLAARARSRGDVRQLTESPVSGV